jgi:hypothetical protein
MKKEQRQGIKITTILYNAVIIGSAIMALTSGFKIIGS